MKLVTIDYYLIFHCFSIGRGENIFKNAICTMLMATCDFYQLKKLLYLVIREF